MICYWKLPYNVCGDLPPIPRTVGVNNLSAHNS